MAYCNSESLLSSVFVRLGGFHLPVSFMGAIGYVMVGSDVELLVNVLCIIHARQCTEKMLTGHAYSRALKGHILYHLALARAVLSTMSITDDENQAILDVPNDIGAANFS